MKYCSNCGHALREGVTVCPNCGHNLEGKRAVKNNRMSKKNKSIIIMAAILILIVIIALVVISQMLSPEKQIENISQAIEEENAALLVENIDNEISETDAEAYFAYINESEGKDAMSEDLSSLMEADNMVYDEVNDGMNILLTVEENGKQYLLFKNYDIKIPKVSVYSYDDFNIDEFTYDYNGKERRWNGTTDKIVDVIPGIYNFEGVSKIGEDEYNGVINVDLTNDTLASFNPGYFKINLTENISYSSIDIDFDDIAIKVNGEDTSTDFSQYEVTIGPFKTGEEVSIETIVNASGKQLTDGAQVVNPEQEDIILEYTSNGLVEPVVSLELEHDEDEIREVADEQMNKEMKESAREDFEENLEDNAKMFVENYIYSLEAMYLFEDINEVEEYIEEGSGVYNSLSHNIASGTFDGMYIYSVSTSNYSKDGNVITLTANSKREYDALNEPTSFSTVYTLDYDPETLTLTIVDFEDI